MKGKTAYAGKKHMGTMRKVQEMLRGADKLEYVLRKYQQVRDEGQSNRTVLMGLEGNETFMLLQGFCYFGTGGRRRPLSMRTAVKMQEFHGFVQKCYALRDAFVQEAFDKIKEVEDNPEKLAKVILSLKVKY